MEGTLEKHREFGCILLDDEGCTVVNGNRVYFPVNEWVDIPGGINVAIYHGIESTGNGKVVGHFECTRRDFCTFETPYGMHLFRRVRRLEKPCPEKLTPLLRGEIAISCYWLPLEERVRLIMGAPENYRGYFTEHTRELDPGTRFIIAMSSTPYWRRGVAMEAEDLNEEQRRFLLAMPGKEEGGDE